MTARECWINNFLDTQRNAARGPGETFKCSKCNCCKRILGRKLIGMDGKRKLWACTECAKVAA